MTPAESIAEVSDKTTDLFSGTSVLFTLFPGDFGSDTAWSISSLVNSGFPFSDHSLYFRIAGRLKRWVGYWAGSKGKIPHFLKPFLIFFSQNAAPHTSFIDISSANSAFESFVLFSFNLWNKAEPQITFSDLKTATSRGWRSSVVWGGSLSNTTFLSWAYFRVSNHTCDKWPS